MKAKIRLASLSLIGAGLLCTATLSKIISSQQVQARQQDLARTSQEAEPIAADQMLPESATESQAAEPNPAPDSDLVKEIHSPFSVLPPAQRRLSQEKIDQIDNLTIRQFVQFFNDTGEDFEDQERFAVLYALPDHYWIIPTGFYVEGCFPPFGSERYGSDQGLVGYSDEQGMTQIDMADHSKSATVGQVKQALQAYFAEQ